MPVRTNFKSPGVIFYDTVFAQGTRDCFIGPLYSFPSDEKHIMHTFFIMHTVIATDDLVDDSFHICIF